MLPAYSTPHSIEEYLRYLFYIIQIVIFSIPEPVRIDLNAVPQYKCRFDPSRRNDKERRAVSHAREWQDFTRVLERLCDSQCVWPYIMRLPVRENVIDMMVLVEVGFRQAQIGIARNGPQRARYVASGTNVTPSSFRPLRPYLLRTYE